MRELKFNLIQILLKTLFLACVFVLILFVYDTIKDRRIEKKYNKEISKDYPIIPRGEIKKDTAVFNLKSHSDFADSLLNANK